MADPVQKEVACRANKDSVTGRRMFECCEELLGLNREELKRWRFRTYQRIELLVDCLDENLRPRTRARVRKEIRAMASADAEFARMVRYFLRVWGVE
ncbi:hypothetical protein SBA4_1640011 [Candidatus Sulfopaludibacter sp. SbA4]|nr:hypothetical protein SBA4_1640011 [Candidatus Sulfopaludibacter sp. SbA4]